MIKYLSLFSGIGAPESALERLNLSYKLIGFSEIDKYAIKSYCAIHDIDESLNLGDITKIDISKLPLDIDLITHGSPCQDFSIAGKQAGGDKGTETRSSLMWNTVDIVKYCKPKYVLWENVKNLLSKKHKHNFDAYLETMEQLGYNNYYQVLNAKDYGVPQNRERVFTISIKKDIDNGKFIFPKKQELKLRLKDMLEDKVDEKYYITKYDNVTMVNDNYGMINGGTIGKMHDNSRRVYKTDYVAPTINTCGGGNLEPKILETPCIVASRGRNPDNPSSRKVGEHTEQRLEINKKGLCNAITSVQKDNYVVVKEAAKKGYAIAKEGESINLEQPNSKTRRGRVGHGIAQTLTTSCNQGTIDNYRIRKLTPKECWRLMGFKDKQFEKAEKINSNTQLYKQAGNSIVVNVLIEIFKQLFV